MIGGLARTAGLRWISRLFASAEAALFWRMRARFAHGRLEFDEPVVRRFLPARAHALLVLSAMRSIDDPRETLQVRQKLASLLDLYERAGLTDNIPASRVAALGLRVDVGTLAKATAEAGRLSEEFARRFIEAQRRLI